MRKHQEDDTDGDNPLTREARTSWKLGALIVALIVAMVGFVEFDAKRARAEALEVVKPLGEELHKHIARTDAMIPEMQRFAEEQRQTMKAVRQNQYRVCLHLRLAECEPP